jgi:hypothetical protein
MQTHIRQVMPRRIQTVERAVKHMGEGCERVPIARMDMAEGPQKTVETDAGIYIRISINIGIVVKVDESVTPSFPKYRKHQNGKGQANKRAA